MKLPRFFQLFVNKRRKFYPLFISQADNTLVGAQTLLKMIAELDLVKRKSYFKEIKQTETNGDKITLQIYNELRTTFVSPFDRENFNTLASRMDTFLDFIHDSARRIILYNPKEIDQRLVDIVHFIVENAQVLCDIMTELEQMHVKSKSITQKCTRIKEIERTVDDLYEEYMFRVFEQEKDAIELVKLKNIIQGLEDAADRAKDVCDTIKNILNKSA